jgi:hypothetical protein
MVVERRKRAVMGRDRARRARRMWTVVGLLRERVG